MPSPRTRSRSPSPYSKRASRSYAREDRSPSPRPRHYRSRSRSPRQRKEDRPKKSSSGFRWKEKSQRDSEDRRDERRLERGYRDQDRPRQRSPPRRDSGPRDDIEAVFGRQKSPSRSETKKSNGVEEKFEEEPPKEKKKKSKAAPVMTSQEMIIVNVNDRLGTKASIPCLASDPIKLFKAQVAARIGRQPHEIMLKRQGERPFRDGLTLEDYGVSNGVQLDLEIDTGD